MTHAHATPISFHQESIRSVIAEAMLALGDRTRRIKAKLLDGKFQHDIERSVADVASLVMYAKVIENNAHFESLLVSIPPIKDPDIRELCASLIEDSRQDGDDALLQTCISPDDFKRRLTAISDHLQA